MIYPYRLVNWPISTHLGPGFVVFPHGALHQVRTLALHPMLGMKWAIKAKPFWKERTHVTPFIVIKIIYW